MPEERSTTAATTGTPPSSISRPSVISFKNARSRYSSAARAVSRKDILRKIPYKIHMDGVEVTPLPLMEIPSVANLAVSVASGAISETTMQHMMNFVDFKGRIEEEILALHHVSTAGLQPMGAVANLPSMHEVTRLDDVYVVKSSTHSFESDETRAPSEFRMPQEAAEVDLRPGARVTINLIETSFWTLLDIASETALPDDPDYDPIKTDRALFTAERGLVKMRADAILQTIHIWLRAKNTQASRKKKSNKHTMVTYWDLYDDLTSNKPPPIKSRAMVTAEKRKRLNQLALEKKEFLKNNQSLEALSTMEGASAMELSTTPMPSPSVVDATSSLITAPALSGISLAKGSSLCIGDPNNLRFAGLIIERLLQEQYDAATQMAYCDLPPQDRLNPDIRYVYEFKTLWTFQTEQTSNRCVTCITWSANPTIFAVGYGRYPFSTAVGAGYVCVWCIKNAFMPERMVKFKSPVTCCAFSKRHPNLLAVGQINGSMVLMDVSTPLGNILHESPETGEPIWSVAWLGIEGEGEDELLLAGTQDGRILRFRFSDTFKVIQVMQVARSFGNIRGIERVQTAKPALYSLQYATITTLCECPFEPDGYLVGTDDGYLHLCSAHYIRRHLSASSCHDGPVYSCSVSPFIDKIYLTSGADWAIRVWAHGVHDPLLTFSASMEPVEGAAWCTVDSALIASISGKTVSIWDLRRKTSAPAGTVTSPNDENFSALSWAPDGALIVGDRTGKVHVMKLEGKPLRPFLQPHTLASCLRKALRATKPALFTALKRLGDPF